MKEYKDFLKGIRRKKFSIYNSKTNKFVSLKEIRAKKEIRNKI
mgnify:CR=1 FL=1